MGAGASRTRLVKRLLGKFKSRGTPVEQAKRGTARRRSKKGHLRRAVRARNRIDERRFKSQVVDDSLNALNLRRNSDSMNSILSPGYDARLPTIKFQVGSKFLFLNALRIRRERRSKFSTHILHIKN